MAQGLERIPLAVDSDFKAQPVRANFPEQAATDFKLVSFEPDQPAPTPAPASDSGNVLSDSGKLLKMGANTAAQDVRELTGRIPVVGPSIQSGLDWVDAKTHGGKSSDALLKEDNAAMQSGMSKPMQTAMDKKWWDQDKGTFGDAWSDPRAYQAGVLQSLPEQALMMFPAMRLAKGAYAAKIAAGATPEIASLSAARTAQVAGTVIEGSLGGAQSSRQVRDDILDPKKITDEMLGQSDAFKTLLSQGMTPAQARRTLAESQASRAFVTAGVATGLFGGMGDRFLAKIITGSGHGMAKRFIMGAASEGIAEEFPQSYLQQVAQNEAMRAANPKQSLTDDALNQAFGGMAAGGLQGGGMAAVFGHSGPIAHGRPKDAIPAADSGSGPGGGSITGEFIPAEPMDPDRGLTDQSQPGAIYDQNPPALPPGQILLPRTMLPAPEEGGPTLRQMNTAVGLLKHSPRASPELLQRLMRVDQTMATMLYNHWQGQTNGEVAGGETTQVSAQSDQGEGADGAGSGAMGSQLSGAMSPALDSTSAESLPGSGTGVALGATGPDAITPLDVQAHGAATSPFNAVPQPTEAQKQAGNYKKGKIKFQGMDISIENPAGSVRSGKDSTGREWQTDMQHHYGYIKGTIGKDKSHLDVFIKPGAQSARTAYVIDQIDPKTGSFDEHKIVFGADSEADAQAVYHANYEQGWQGMGAITAMPIDQFKHWIKSGKTKKPLAYTEPKEIRTASRTPKTASSLLQAIVNRGGISREIMQDVGADPAGRYMPGLFTKTGTADLSALAGYLFDEDGFHQIHQDSPIGPARELEDLITRALGGEKVLSTAAMEKGMQAEETAKLKEKAQRLGVKTVARKLEDIAAEVAQIEERNILDEETRLEDDALVAYNEAVDALNAAVGEDAAENFLEDLASRYQDETHLNYLRNATTALQEKLNAEVQSAGKPDETIAGQAGSGDETGRAQGGAGSLREEARPALALSSQSEAELAARDRAAQAAEAQRLKDEQADENKRQADAERGSFNLTGSDRPADVLAARGQGGLFDQPTNSEKQPAAPVAESLAPAPSEPGDDGVATIQGGAAAEQQRKLAVAEFYDARYYAGLTLDQYIEAAIRQHPWKKEATRAELKQEHDDWIETEREQRGLKPAQSRSNVVIRDVRDADGNKLGAIIEPYDGTEDGARQAAERVSNRMWDDYQDASNIQSRIGATDESGNPKWAISPNFAHINPVDTAEGLATFGDEDAIREVYGKTQASTGAIAGKPVADMSDDQLRTIARGLSPTFGEAAVDKAKTEINRRNTALREAKPKESAIDAALRSVGADPNAPADEAKSLRREAEKLQREAREMLDRIPPGQPVSSTRDRNLREKSAEKSRKAGELFGQADAIDAEKVGAGETVTKDQGLHFASGVADFKARKPRELPSYFTKATGKNPRDWYRGWDEAKASAQPDASIAGKPVSEMSDGMLNQIAKSSQPAAEKAKAEVAKRKKPKADPLAAVREFYTPGNIIHVDYWNQYDKVLEFKEGDLPGQWNVKVQQVKKDGDQWVPKDDRMEPPRWHATAPGKDKIVDRVAMPTEQDRDSFTLDRLNGDAMEPVTFERGEYVRYTLSGKYQFGDIDGISHARREFSVDGLWYPFGFAYKAERPVPAKAKDAVPLSSVVEAVNKKHGEGLTDADRVPTQPPSTADAARDDAQDQARRENPNIKTTLAEHDATTDRLRDGTATLAEYKAAFQRLQNSTEDLTAEFAAMKKDDILKHMGGMSASRYKSENKAKVVDLAVRDLIEDFSIGRGIMYGMGGRNAYAEAVRDQVEGTTDADLAEYASKVKEARASRTVRVEQMTSAMKDPKTLADFKMYLDIKAGDTVTREQARMMLTPEQRVAFDELAAEQSREERKGRADQQRMEVRAPGEAVGASEIIKTKHTKHGHDLWQFTLERRVPPDEFKSLVMQAKRMGGDYSSYRGNGAIPGWQFRTEEAAIAFRALVAGDTAAAKEVMQSRRDDFEDDRSQSAVERLTEMADRLEERADESLNLDRKENTDRRARMAASAEAAANSDKSLAKTMRNIAQAIESGKTKFLDRVRQKAQVEMLRGFLYTAKANELRAKFPSYGDQEKHRSVLPTAETADYVDFPRYTAFRSDLATMGRQMLDIDGAKKVGAALLKVADDVSAAYLAFAKEHLHQVSTFKTGAGKGAVFASKDDAEAAIKRSGFKGKAVVLPFKRGQNIIIMSPSAAKESGIWKGDDDKRITLSPEFGEEVVARVKEFSGHRISMPYLFESVRAERARLKSIGIETAAELRAALREFMDLRAAPPEVDKVKQMERAMIGRKNDGLDFFPTPASVADELVQAADIKEGMSVLEPSAGMGHIAERIRAAGVDPDVVEMASDRRDLLEAKGFRLVGADFMNMSPRGFTYGDVFRDKDGVEGVMRGSGGLGSNRVGFIPVGKEERQSEWRDRDELTGAKKSGYNSGYDRIIMNPPFSDRRDAEHVQHAYTLLRPGGRIVAIMGEGVFFGQDKKAQAFRNWLDEVGGTSEKLEEGTFLDPSLPVNTGVNARMVVIEKSTGGMESRTNGEGQEQTASTRAIQSVVDKFRNQFAGAAALNIRVARTVADIPARFRPSPFAEGVFHDDTGLIYLVTMNLKHANGQVNTGRVWQVLMHEAVGHFGLAQMMGDRFKGILKHVMQAAKAKGNVTEDIYQPGHQDYATVEAVRLRYPDASDEEVAQEVLARMAETDPGRTLFGYVRAVVRQWLRDMARAAGVALNVTTTELNDMVARASHYMRRGDNLGAETMPSGAVMASKTKGMESRAHVSGDSGRQYTAEQQRTFANIGREVVTPTLKERVTSIWQGVGKKMTQGIVDQFAPLKDIDQHAYLLARMSKAADGALEALMLYGKVFLRDGVYDVNIKDGGVIDKLLAPLGAEADDFMWWVAGNRADTLTKESASARAEGARLLNQASVLDYQAKQAEADAKQILQQAGNFSKHQLGSQRQQKANAQQAEALLREAKRLYREASAARTKGNSLKDVSRENLMTPDDIKALKDLATGKLDFDYKLPNGTTTRDRATAFKAAQEIFSEFNKSVMDVAEESGLIDGAARSVWEREFYVPFYREMEGDKPNFPNVRSGLVRQKAFERLKGGTEKLNSDLLANTIKNWSHLLNAASKNRAAKATLEAAENVGAATWIPAAEKGSVFFRDQGEEFHYRVEDPFVLDAVTALEFAGFSGPAMSAMGAFKRWLTMGVTANPAFKIRNLIRDSVQAIGTAEMSYNPLTNLREGFASTSKESQTYASMLASGGHIRFGTMIEGNRASNVRRLVEQGVAPGTILDSESKIKAAWNRHIMPLVDAYNELGDRSENINRAAIYEQLRAKGMNHADASLQARDLMDFSMGGTWAAVRFLTQTVPFANARLQGLYKVGRAAKEDPRRFGYVVGAVALASLALLGAYHDDEDWKKREDWDRDNYWWFKVGGMAFRIPKPFEIGSIGTLAERSAELLFEKEMDGHRFGQRLVFMASNTFSMNPVPQMLKPIFDVYSNKDSFTGRPIEGMGMERLRPEDRFTMRSSEFAKLIGKAGVISPLQVDQLIRGYFGWLGTAAVTSVDQMVRVGDGTPRAAMQLRDAFLVGNFVETLPSGSSRYVTQMYEQSKEVEQAYASWKSYLKSGNKEKADEIYADNKDKINRYRLFENIKRSETAMNEQTRRIEADKNMSGAAKRVELDKIAAQKDKFSRSVIRP